MGRSGIMQRSVRLKSDAGLVAATLWGGEWGGVSMCACMACGGPLAADATYMRIYVKYVCAERMLRRSWQQMQ